MTDLNTSTDEAMTTHPFFGSDKNYAQRDIFQMDKKGGYYVRHVQALTAENLHLKSDIAGELGYRDMLIDFLAERLKELEGMVEGFLKAQDLVKLGEELDKAGAGGANSILFGILHASATSVLRERMGLPSTNEIDAMIADHVRAATAI